MGDDLKLTWTFVARVCLVTLENGDEEGKRIAREEVMRMAKAADLWNDHCKKEGSIDEQG